MNHYLIIRLQTRLKYYEDGLQDFKLHTLICHFIMLKWNKSNNRKYKQHLIGSKEKKQKKKFDAHFSLLTATKEFFANKFPYRTGNQILHFARKMCSLYLIRLHTALLDLHCHKINKIWAHSYRKCTLLRNQDMALSLQPFTMHIRNKENKRKCRD